MNIDFMCGDSQQAMYYISFVVDCECYQNVDKSLKIDPSLIF